MNSTIQNFREFINNNQTYIYNVYSNKNGRDQWSCICACMNWIELAIDYISNLESNEGNINEMSMRMYSYISAIDIVWESVQQLHRVIVSINKDTMPFNGEISIFENKLNLNDNEYFKHLRAVFGAHPINIKNKQTKSKGADYFANWPNIDRFGEYDFVSTLWSADTEAEDMRIGFKFEQLEKFLDSRYNYILELKEKLNNEIEKHYNNMREIKIKSSNDIKVQLYILRDELDKRLKDDDYQFIVDKLISFFEAKDRINCNQYIIETYLNKMVKLVDELKTNIQDMNFIKLKNEYIVNLDYPQDIYYNLSKVHDYYYNYEKNIDNYNFYIKPIAEFLKDYIDINYDMDYDECKLSINAGLFEYWRKNK